MRPRLNPNDKRTAQIGIKVKKETKDKLEFIASREAHPVSTQIDIILKDYIDRYLKDNRIDWSEYASGEEVQG